MCVCMLIQLKRSPTVGRGARDVAEPIGSLEKSGRLARWDFNSSLTTVTRSSLPWYSWGGGEYMSNTSDRYILPLSPGPHPTQLDIISSTELMAGEDPTSSLGLSPEERM